MYNILTLRKETGSSISTLRFVTLLVMSVSSFKKSLSIFCFQITPVCEVCRLNFLRHGCSNDSYPFRIRSLHIVEVDSLLRPLNNIFPKNVLISVGFS